jgi:hypothetical protein
MFMKTIDFSNGWGLLGLGVWLALAGGCGHTAPAGRPAWVVGRAHRDFPAERYLLGVGTGAGTGEALAAARGDLHSRVRERLELELNMRAPKLAAGGIEALRPSSAEALLANLPPAGLALKWRSRDGTRHAAMVAVERQRLANELAGRVRQHENRALELSGRARGRRSESPYEAVVDLLTALRLRIEAEHQRALLAAVSPAPPPGSRGPSLGELFTELDTMLAAVRLIAGRGDGLVIDPAATDVTLVLAVDLRGEDLAVPLARCPVAFELPGPAEPARIEARTDAAGMATVELPAVAPFAGRALQITARLDPGRMLRDAGAEPGAARWQALRQRLIAKRARFALRVNSAAARRLALVIAETVAGRFRPHSRLLDQLSRRLARDGFRPVDFDELDIELPQQPTPAAMAELVHGKAELLLYGAAATALEREVAAGLVFARARSELLLVEVASGRTLAELGPEAKAAGRDLESASDRALDALARKLHQDIAAAAPAEPAKP